MNKSEYKIHIIGGGISGLIAAQVLENSGYHPVIIEATDRVGGRVKTDIVEGCVLDHGFQVLLTAYPAAKRYLDYDALTLQHFLPGAQIFTDKGSTLLGDPLRSIKLLLPTLFSNVGSIADKWKVLRLNRLLKKTEISEIFEEKEETTFYFLKKFGFSETMINHFFKPFFGGIFLEANLQTSSRMFKFVYKMFGEGNAAIPKKGIEQIPIQLKANLKFTSFKYHTRVKYIEEQKIVLENGEDIKSHFTIVATDPNVLIPNLRNQEITWKSCDTLYFKTKQEYRNTSLIGLIAQDSTLINNICSATSLEGDAKTSKKVVSVTVVKDHQLDLEELIQQVSAELERYCNIQVDHFIKRYEIRKALPDLSNIQYEMLPSETQLSSSIFLAGDQQLNASLNAAMISGERAALGVINTLEKGLIVEEFTSEFN